MALPNFIVVGAAKSGTTALWYYLSQHPDIFVCSPKETNYFVSDVISKGNHINTLERYEALFEPGRKCARRGEVTPAYLAKYDVAATRIKETLPDCKIVILLRNPVDRVFSRYLGHFVRDKNCQRPFEEVMEEIKDAELHAKGVAHFQELFEHENVGIFLTEQMDKNITTFVSRLWDFLGVPHAEISDVRKVNQSGVPASPFIEKCFTLYRLFPEGIKDLLRRLPNRIKVNVAESLRSLNLRNRPVMNEESRRKLERFFEAEIESLEALSGMNLKAQWLPQEKLE